MKAFLSKLYKQIYFHLNEVLKMNKDECCPKFDPKQWDEKKFEWKNKQFLIESIPALFHFPFFPLIGKKIMKMFNLAKKAKVDMPLKETLMLFYDPHPFKSEIYLSVTKPVKGAKNVTLSGTFLTKVYEGPYKDVPKSMKKMNKYLAGKRKKAEKYYVHYAYCPKCTKKFGTNYMIMFAKVK